MFYLYVEEKLIFPLTLQDPLKSLEKKALFTQTETLRHPNVCLRYLVLGFLHVIENVRMSEFL